ncbi:hypothetical protein ACEE86_19115 [Proteus mirabilis]
MKVKFNAGMSNIGYAVTGLSIIARVWCGVIFTSDRVAMEGKPREKNRRH